MTQRYVAAIIVHSVLIGYAREWSPRLSMGRVHVYVARLPEAATNIADVYRI